MTHHTAKQIDQAIRNAKASLEIEGLRLTKEMELLVRKKLNGELNEEEFLKEAILLSQKGID